MSEIRVTYTSVDHCRTTKRFKTLKGARNFAHKMVGPHPEMGSFYAVSGDGVGKIIVTGCSLVELFPAPAESPEDLSPTQKQLHHELQRDGYALRPDGFAQAGIAASAWKRTAQSLVDLDLAKWGVNGELVAK